MPLYVPGGTSVWTQIGEPIVVSSPAATVTFSSIPATYSTLGIVVLGASHNNGTNVSFQLGVSSNGGGLIYSRTFSVSTHPASDALSGFLQIFGYTQDVASVYGAIGAWSSANIVGGGTQNLAFARLDGNPINLVQLSWSAGNFDAGTFTLLGK